MNPVEKTIVLAIVELNLKVAQEKLKRCEDSQELHRFLYQEMLESEVQTIEKFIEKTKKR